MMNQFPEEDLAQKSRKSASSALKREAKSLGPELDSDEAIDNAFDSLLI